MDPTAYSSTHASYEKHFRRWIAARQANKQAARFGQVAPKDGLTLDLGCRPGWDLPNFESAVGLDYSHNMLNHARGVTDGYPLVRADILAPPFRRQVFKKIWAERSLVHLFRADVPMALRHLHEVTRPGSRVHFSFLEGDDSHRQFRKDPHGHRWFSFWPLQLLDDVLNLAGFRIDQIERSDSNGRYLGVKASCIESVASTIGPGMRVLLVGMNPSPTSAMTGVPYGHRSNRAWPALRRAGFASEADTPESLFSKHRVGMTDFCKRTTVRAAELTNRELSGGLARLNRICEWLKPKVVCVMGITGWRQATRQRKANLGWQEVTVGGRATYVMPNPSGLNAHTNAGDLAAHLREVETKI